MRSLAQLRLSLLAILRRAGIISSAHALSSPRPAIVADTTDATNGALQFVTYIGTRTARFGAPVNSVNWPTLLGSITGNPVVIQATGDGTDANIDISIQPTGSGAVNTVGLLSVERAGVAGLTDLILATKTNSGGAGQNNDGASFVLAAESTTPGTNLDAVSFDGILTDASVAGATSALVVRTRFDGSAMGEALRVTRIATTITQAAGSLNTTPGPALTVTGGAHLGNIASVEVNDVLLNLARTVTWDTGALAVQRAMLIGAPTYQFTGPSVLTDAATVWITGAPVEGANATITNSYALMVEGLTGIVPNVETSGVRSCLLVRGAIDTGLTAATEQVDVNFDLGRTVTWAAGAGPLALQRAFAITAPTYDGDAGEALTIDNAATLYISAAPTDGANLTITNNYALFVDAGRVRFDGPVVQNDYPVIQNTGTDGAPVAVVNTPSGVVAVPNGATTVVVTCAACTADTHIHAVIRNATTNPTQIVSVIPIGGSFTVTISADPGATGAIIGVLIHQPGSGV